MKTSTGTRRVDDEKVSRRLELVRNGRPSCSKSAPRFRIGLADNLFENPVPRFAREMTEQPEMESCMTTETAPGMESQRAEIPVVVAAVAGLIFGYLIGRRR